MSMTREEAIEALQKFVNGYEKTFAGKLCVKMVLFRQSKWSSPPSAPSAGSSWRR